MIRPVLAAGALLALLIAAAPTHAAEPLPARYIDAPTALLDDAEHYEGWYTAAYGLRRDFDAICGDTFCGGDYTNLQPLRFACSVEAATGRVSRCVWSFAGSNETVNPLTGAIAVDAPVFRCRIALARGTTIQQLVRALSVEEPLYAPLPMGARPVYEAIGDCFEPGPRR